MFLWRSPPPPPPQIRLAPGTFNMIFLSLSQSDWPWVCVWVPVCAWQCACMYVPTSCWFSNWPYLSFFPCQIRKLLEKPKEKVLKKPFSARPGEVWPSGVCCLINNRSPLWKSSCTFTPPHLAQSDRGLLSHLPLFSTSLPAFLARLVGGKGALLLLLIAFT